MDARVTYKDNHLFGLFSYIDLRRRRKNKTDYHWDKFRVGRGRRRSAQTSSIIIIYNIYKYIHRYLCVHIRTKIMWSVSEIKILRQIRRTCNYILLCINIYIYIAIISVYVGRSSVSECCIGTYTIMRVSLFFFVVVVIVVR